MAAKKQFVVGIDLGTTNIVVSYCSLTENDSTLNIFPIPQLTSPGQIEALPMLPALRYHFDVEVDESTARLPWGIDPINQQLPKAIIGKYAQDLGNKAPTRLVSSAKSWLGYRGESNAEINLPDQAGDEVNTCTPLEASAGFLAYIAAAWDHAFPTAKLHEQMVIITVPASFDDIARALTIESIRRAGIQHFNLLEEPQAACYYWVAEHDVAQLKNHQHLMVCDVGGGTTDFTLIKIGKLSENAAAPEMERIAVGDHLMLGGDNMDLTLAAKVLQKMALPPNQRTMSQLLGQCQKAKEILLGENAPEEYRILLQTGGSSLFAGTKEARLTQKEVQQTLLDGFFPLVSVGTKPKARKRSLTDLTLPYPADAAISRHISSFLYQEQQALATEEATDEAATTPVSLPDVWLLNGGPFLSHQIQARLKQLISQWSSEPAAEISWLTNPEPQTAVAKGATIFGRALAQNQQLIKSAVIRHYFLKVAAKDGDKAVCVLPKHTDLNAPQNLAQQFTLVKGKQVQFDVAYSLEERKMASGDTLAWDEKLHLLPALTTTIEGNGEVSVTLESQLDELGVLSVILQEEGNQQRHELHFNLRKEDATPEHCITPELRKAVAIVESWFGSASKTAPKEPLKKSLEKVLGKRETWSGGDARHLFDHLLQLANRRRRSEVHERSWFNLAGYCLRPGIGFAGDKARIAAVWQLYGQGIQYVQSAEIWAQWWAFWRRAAAGLSQEQQLVLYTDSNHVLPANKRKKGGKVKVTAAVPEKLRLIGSLERLPVKIKQDILNTVSNQLADKKVNKDMAWCAARLVNRNMIYGDGSLVLPETTIIPVLEQALSYDWKQNTNLALMAVSGAKKTELDASDGLSAIRETVSVRLTNQQQNLKMMLTEGNVSQQDKQLWGDVLPGGLSLA